MMIALNRPICVTKLIGMANRIVAIIPICIIRIHSRRRPKRSDEKVSTKGPTIHLNAHGR